jgi:RNA polymerase sporulation-specific sigma factor
MDKSKLITDNINLVYYVLHKYYPYSIADEDLIQAGMVGLCVAAERYNEELGKFSVYAVKGIRNYMNLELKNRKKFANQISLSTEVKLGEGEDGAITLEDILPGDEGIDFLDSDTYLSELTEVEKRVVEMRLLGYTRQDIGAELGVSSQTAGNICRKIKHKWSKII